MEERPLSQTEESLLAFWRDLFGSGEIGIHDDFFVLGGHSLLVARLSARVADLFGLDLPLVQVFEMPTIAELSAYIDQQRAEGQDTQLLSSSLVRLKSGQPYLPLFCMHTFLGGVSDYLPLARHFGPEQPIYAVQGQGLIDNRLPATSVGAMAAHCVKEIRKLQPHGPYHLVGASFAGLIAFEAAQQLGACGEKVALLALLDTWLPYQPSKLQLRTYVGRYIRLQRLRASYHYNRQRRALHSHLAQLVALPSREKQTYVRIRVMALKEQLLGKAARRLRATSQTDPCKTMELEVRHNRMLQASQAAIMRYRPSIYAGRMVYFYATDPAGAPPFDQRQAWTHLAGKGLEVYLIPGNHHVMLGEPNVQTVASILKRHLNRVHREEGKQV